MKIATSILLVIGGLTGIIVGGAQLFLPQQFELSAGIDLGSNASLLSEIRAAGGTLFAAGIIILSGVFSARMRSVSLQLSMLFYLSYGLSRVAAIALDGLPAPSLIIAMIMELLIGAGSWWIWRSSRVNVPVSADRLSIPVS